MQCDIAQGKNGTSCGTIPRLSTKNHYTGLKSTFYCFALKNKRHSLLKRNYDWQKSIFFQVLD
jgi:hypothetical protein